MTRLLRLACLGLFVSILGSAIAQNPSPATETPPNIVLILADDLGIYDLACYGRSEHRTTNLDRLANEGIRYTSAYCGLSICSASRAALLTSKYPARLHLTTYLPGRANADTQRLRHPLIEPALIPSAQTLAETLKRDGYATGIFGKWHLGGGDSAPGMQGFEIAFEPPGNGDPLTTGGKNEFLITDKAIEFIKTQSESNKPYFCYVPHHSPHIMLKEREDRIAANAAAWNPLYAATIESLDESIGRLLQAIEESPSAKNTIVIFTSDNGGLHVPEGHAEPVTHNGPFRAGKGYLYEGGLRVPLIVRWPKHIAPGKRTETPVSLMDLMPSLLESASIDVGRSVGPLDGLSLRKHWLGESEVSEDRTFYWHFPHYTNQGSKPSGAVRKGQWKWIEDYENLSGELYDLSQDISETHNVAKEHPEVAKSLHLAFEKWKASIAAQECVPNPSINPELNQELYTTNNASSLRVGAKSPQEIGTEWKDWRSKLNQAIAGKPTILKKTPAGITLPASNAITHGTRIRYEPETFKNVVGYWTEVDDWAEWEMQVPKSGLYRLEIHSGCGAGNGGSLVHVEIESGNAQTDAPNSPNATSETIEWTVRETGHFQNIVIESLGDVRLVEGKGAVRVKPQKKAAAAVVDIREIHLIPID